MQRKWRRNWRRAVSKRVMPPVMAGMLLLGATGAVYANPTGGVVTSGAATIASTGSTMTVNQSTDKASINWQSFNIASGEKVQFVQPGVSSVALNRIVGNNASSIYGTLSANGKVYLINPNGMLFARGAQVNVGGLVASTLNMSDSDFTNGKYTFSGSGTGSVVNQGTITAANEAVLIGPRVKNEGVIAAKVAGLAAGNKVSLDFNGDSLLNVTVDTGAAGGSATNSGAITADGGLVVMSAGTKDALLNTVVNNSGVIRAESVNNVNGVIRLEGNSVTNSGTLDASGKAAGETGGTVALSGENLVLASGSLIDASGSAGGGTVTVGGWSSDTVNMAKGATVTAAATVSGKGGKITLIGGNTATVAGTLTADGGNGGTIETSGGTLDVAGATVSAAVGCSTRTI